LSAPSLFRTCAGAEADPWSSDVSRLLMHLHADRVELRLPACGVCVPFLRELISYLHFLDGPTRSWSISVSSAMEGFGKRLRAALSSRSFTERPDRPRMEEIDLRFDGPVYPGAVQDAPTSWLPFWMKFARDHAKCACMQFSGHAAEQVSKKWKRGKMPRWDRNLRDWGGGVVGFETSCHPDLVTLRVWF